MNFMHLFMHFMNFMYVKYIKYFMNFMYYFTYFTNFTYLFMHFMNFMYFINVNALGFQRVHSICWLYPLEGLIMTVLKSSKHVALCT